MPEATSENAALKGLYDEITQLFEEFKLEAVRGIEKDVKKARMNARTKSVEIDKKLKQFRAESIKLDQR